MPSLATPACPIAKTAEREGKAPIDICSTYVTGFQCHQRFLFPNDDYVRLCCQNIYLNKYSGSYNVEEEAFVTDNEAELCNFCDPSTGQPRPRGETY
jgi:methionyl-tRNA synthetase